MTQSHFLQTLAFNLQTSLSSCKSSPPDDANLIDWQQQIDQITEIHSTLSEQEKEQWISLSKSLSELAKSQGNQSLSSNQNEQAVIWFSVAILLTPENHILYSNRSAAFANLRRYPEALKDAEKVIEIDSTWAKGYSRKGLALYFMKKYDESLEAYQKGLSLDPTNEITIKGLETVQVKVKALDANEKGEEAVAKNKIPEAIAYFTKAIDLDATEYLFYANRSEANLKNMNAVQALADSDEIIKLYPQWVKAYIRKGDALMFLTRYDEAISALSVGLNIDPNNSVLQSKLTQATQEAVRQRQKMQATSTPSPTGTPPARKEAEAAASPENPKEAANKGGFGRFFTYVKDKLDL